MASGQVANIHFNANRIYEVMHLIMSRCKKFGFMTVNESKMDSDFYTDNNKKPN